MLNLTWPSNVNVIFNKYYTIYVKIIEKALERNRPLEYIEMHHIIPRACGGTNCSNNLVPLLAKEHYIVHRLLTKFLTDLHLYKMLYAIDAMGMRCKNTTQRYIIPSRVYHHNKMLISQHGLLEETKEKIGNANRGRPNKYKGQPRPTEVIEKMRGRPAHNKGKAASNKVKATASLWHSQACWIHNPITRKNKKLQKLHLSTWLAQGWATGRIDFKKHSEYVPTTNHKLKIKNIMKSLVWIVNIETKKTTRVSTLELNEYLNQNWIMGRYIK